MVAMLNMVELAELLRLLNPVHKRRGKFRGPLAAFLTAAYAQAFPDQHDDHMPIVYC